MNIAGPFTVTIGAYPNTSAQVETPMLDGRIVAVGIEVHTNTGDINITTKGSTNTPAQTIFDKNAVNADVWHYPMIQMQTFAGVNIAGIYEHAPVFDQLVILVENAGAGESFDITFLVE